MSQDLTVFIRKFNLDLMQHKKTFNVIFFLFQVNLSPHLHRQIWNRMAPTIRWTLLPSRHLARRWRHESFSGTGPRSERSPSNLAPSARPASQSGTASTSPSPRPTSRLWTLRKTSTRSGTDRSRTWATASPSRCPTWKLRFERKIRKTFWSVHSLTSLERKLFTEETSNRPLPSCEPLQAEFSIGSSLRDRCFTTRSLTFGKSFRTSFSRLRTFSKSRIVEPGSISDPTDEWKSPHLYSWLWKRALFFLPEFSINPLTFWKPMKYWVSKTLKTNTK